jgi:predicted nucleotidyltransferase
VKPYEAPEIQKELNIIKDAVLSVIPNAEAIYLFGSYAYGIPNEHSDIDVYVVAPNGETRHPFDLASEIYLQLDSEISTSVDILVQRSDVFQRRSLGPTLAGTVLRKGVRVYG